MFYFLRAIWRRPGGLWAWWPELGDSSTPSGTAAAVWILVPWQFKSQGSREAADPRWGLPGARVWDDAWAVCSHGPAGGSAQTPAAGRSRRSGECVGGGDHRGRDEWSKVFYLFYWSCIFAFSLLFRSVPKTIGLKVWVTWSVTTWTTDFLSYQLVAKCVCNSQ